MQLMTLREHDGGALRIRALEGAQVVEQRAQLGAVVEARRDRDHRVLVDTIVNPFCQTLLPQRAIRIRAVRIHAPQWRALALVAEISRDFWKRYSDAAGNAAGWRFKDGCEQE